MRVSPSFSVGVLAANATAATAAKEGKAKCCQLSSSDARIDGAKRVRLRSEGNRNAEFGTTDGHESGDRGEGREETE